MEYRTKIHQKDDPIDNVPVEFELINQNYFTNALVVINNLVARATTKWTLEETKLFLCAVSKVKTRDKDNWVVLPKKDIIKAIGIEPTEISKLRNKFANVVKKSYIQLNGPTSEEWHDGVLLTDVKSTKREVAVRFNDTYLPLLDELSGHFTEFYLDQVTGLKRKASYNLYVYLTSWHNKKYSVNTYSIAKKDLDKVFNLKPGQYWRNYDDPDKRKFDWASFEKKCLIPAIQDINGRYTCDLEIINCWKATDGHHVLGYGFQYAYYDDGDIHRDPRYKLDHQKEIEIEQLYLEEINTDNYRR